MIASEAGGGAAELVDLGHRLSQAGRIADAAEAFHRALALDDAEPMAHNNLGWVRTAQGDHDGAIASYRRALTLAPDLRIARRNLAMLLVRLDRADESLDLWYREAQEGGAWIDEQISATLVAGELRVAGAIADMFARIRWGSAWCPVRPGPGAALAPLPLVHPVLTVPKLRHDLDQLAYLRDRGLVGDELAPVVSAYTRTLARVAHHGPEDRLLLDDEDRAVIGDHYSRMVHMRPTPAVERALSDRWAPAAIEDSYLEHPPGVVVIDDFLAPEALASLRAYCLESTLWSANRYTYGRLGAFFRDGFCCPLLLQIADELRRALPRVIGERYPLRQLWGFKNDHTVPGDATLHADFAAVNVNFWITPDEANLDPRTGGLVVYEVDAPLDWDFYTYNANPGMIRAYLERHQARSVTVPYRANRAVLFNSDLFHCTDALRFRPGYEHRRINITMLYGQREQDQHHRPVARDPTSPRDWRSAAFRRARGR